MNKTIFLLIFWYIFFFLHIINFIEARETHLIVDSSFFETLPDRNPFAPQVPQEDIRIERVAPDRPVDVAEPVVSQPPPREEEPPVYMPRLDEARQPPIPDVPLPSLKISGVLWNTNRPQAIINGQIVGIGDVVSGVKVVDIQKTGIAVLFGAKTMTLEIERDARADDMPKQVRE